MAHPIGAAHASLGELGSHLIHHQRCPGSLLGAGVEWFLGSPVLDKLDGPEEPNPPHISYGWVTVHELMEPLPHMDAHVLGVLQEVEALVFVYRGWYGG